MSANRTALLPGTRVKHKHDERINGLVIECVNEHDCADVKSQGYRYLVLGKKSYVWSTLGDNLMLVANSTPEVLLKLGIHPSQIELNNTTTAKKE